MTESDGIFIKKGELPGKTLAVFAGIHGNEKAGVFALKKAVSEIMVEKGTVYFVLANLKAIEKNVREVDGNMNRLFVRDLDNASWEYSRAKKLMDILDVSDALLDLHASNSRITQPFAICDEKSMELAKKLDVGIISTGWNRLSPRSTDAYMSARGKIAVCLECGSVFETEKNVPLAYDSIYRFLQEFGAISGVTFEGSRRHTHIEVTKAITKQSENFAFTSEFDDFDRLAEGKVFAIDGDLEYKAGSNEYILFPRPNKPVGGEACVIGRLVI